MTQVSSKSMNHLGDRRGLHPNSLANLVPEPPPETRNKKGYSLKSRLFDALDKPLVKPKDDAPAGARVVYATIQGAIDLNPAALRETWDRVEGKVVDTHAIIGDVTIRIIEDG